MFLIVFGCFAWWKGDKRTMFCSVRWRRWNCFWLFCLVKRDKKTMFCSVRWRRWLLCLVRWRRWLLCLVRMRECNIIYRVETMFTQICDTYFRQRKKNYIGPWQTDTLIHTTKDITFRQECTTDKSAQDITINQECSWHTDTKECPVTWKRNWYNDTHWQKECPVTVQLQPQYGSGNTHYYQCHVLCLFETEHGTWLWW